MTLFSSVHPEMALFHNPPPASGQVSVRLYFIPDRGIRIAESTPK